MSKAEFTSFLKRVLECLVQASADGSIHFTCMDWAHLHELLDAGRAVYDELTRHARPPTITLPHSRLVPMNFTTMMPMSAKDIRGIVRTHSS